MFTIRKTAAILISMLLLASGVMTVLAEPYDQPDAGILLSEGRLDEAESALNKKLSSDSKDVVTLSLLGELYRQKREYKKALQYLDRAISIDSKYPVAYMYRGKLYFSMQKPEDAVAEFTLFMENMRPLVTDDAKKQFYISNLHDISVICFEIKRYEELRTVLDEILKLSPMDQTALYNLGVYYYTYERNRSNAYNSFSKVIKIDPATQTAARAKYAIEFMRENPDPIIAPTFSFIDK